MKALLALLFSVNAQAVPNYYTHGSTAALMTFVGLELFRDEPQKEVKVVSVVMLLGLFKEVVLDKKVSPDDLGANMGGITLTLFVREF